MEPTRPFFERALYLNPTKHCFAYATFVGHGRLIRGRDRVAIDHGPGAAAAVDEDGFREGSPTVNHEYVDFLHVPEGMQIYKKNVSICGFSAPSNIRVAQTPAGYLRDLMKNGLEECYPKKQTIVDYFQEKPSLLQHYGMTDVLQAEQETCNVLSDKNIFLNKSYSIAGLVDATHSSEFEVGGLYKFNVVFISRVDEPQLNDRAISFVSPEGKDIHYMQLGPFNLFDINDVRQLKDNLGFNLEYQKEEIYEKKEALHSKIWSADFPEEEEARLMREHKALMNKYIELGALEEFLEFLVFKINKPDREKRFSTSDVFNIFKILHVDIAYIIDTSCSNVSGSTSGKRLILPEGVGYGRKRKSKRIKQYNKYKKSRKRKSYLK
jgi:hypothetical protein